MMPNGVGTASPPAKSLPPRTVWQSLQLPIAARSRPRLTRAGAKDCGEGDSIAAIAGRHSITKHATAATITTPATTLATICDLVIRPRPALFIVRAEPCLTHIAGYRSHTKHRSLPVEIPWRLRPTIMAKRERPGSTPNALAAHKPPAASHDAAFAQLHCARPIRG